MKPSTTEPVTSRAGWRVAVTAAIAVILAAMALAACGSDDDSDTEQSQNRIVSLSPTATEMLFAIGAGDQVVAADEFSDYPSNAPTVAGLSGYQPNLEAIAEYEPTHVVAQAPIEGLDALDIELIVQPAAANFDDVWDQLAQLGVATDTVDETSELVKSLRSDLDEATSKIGDQAASMTYYHELDPTLYSVTSQTFIGEVYDLFGMTNIADAHDPDGFSYPQLTQEVIVAEDPDLIFLADTKCCEASAATVAERPGWDSLTAVANGDIVELDDDVASRWGPRVIDFVNDVAAGIDAALSTTTG